MLVGVTDAQGMSDLGVTQRKHILDLDWTTSSEGEYLSAFAYSLWPFPASPRAFVRQADMVERYGGSG